MREGYGVSSKAARVCSPPWYRWIVSACIVMHLLPSDEKDARSLWYSNIRFIVQGFMLLFWVD